MESAQSRQARLDWTKLDWTGLGWTADDDDDGLREAIGVVVLLAGTELVYTLQYIPYLYFGRGAVSSKGKERKGKERKGKERKSKKKLD